ncbi:MAG: ATP-grasp domain-containing protein, partial [Psychromonas sp.]
MKQKRLLLLGGINLAQDIVNAAKEIGVEIYVTDYFADSPAKKIADKSFMVNAFDVDAVVELCKEQQIDGVISGYVDPLMAYCSKTSSRLNLPNFYTLEQIDKTSNKNNFSTLCESFDIPVAKRYTVRKESLQDDVKQLEYPVILKPADASGGKGVKICKDDAALLNAFDGSISFSTVGEVIVERYIKGPEATIFYLFQDGNVHLTAVSNRYIRQDQDTEIPLPVAYCMPSNLTQSYLDTINPKMISLLKHLNVKNGMAFIQCKLADDTFYFYDIGLRLTGSREYKLLEKTCGFNPLKMMINYAVSGKMSDKDITPLVNPLPNLVSGNLTILCKPGKIDKICGIDEIREFECVSDLHQSYFAGDEIVEKSIGTLAQVVVRVMFVCNSRIQLAQAMDIVISKIEVISDEGKNLLLPAFDT